MCIVDMCATLRFHTMFSSTPAVVAASLMRRCSGSQTIILHYDDNRVSCPLRDELHQKRYKPMLTSAIRAASDAGKVIVNGRAFRRGHRPMTSSELHNLSVGDKIDWARMWNSRDGKMKLYKLVQDAIKKWCVLHSTVSVVSWLGDDKFIYPYEKNDDLEVHTRYPYQEADQRVCWSVCIARARGFNGTIIVHTCDTDMVMQMTASPVGVKRTVVQFRGWWLDVPKLRTMVQKHGGGRSVCFWMIVAGGCDYCPSATTWGYGGKELSANIWGGFPVGQDNVMQELTNGLASVHIRSQVKRGRVSVEDEVVYARRARHCVRLFACDDPSVGGPVWDAHEKVCPFPA